MHFRLTFFEQLLFWMLFVCNSQLFKEDAIIDPIAGGRILREPQWLQSLENVLLLNGGGTCEVDETSLLRLSCIIWQKEFVDGVKVPNQEKEWCQQVGNIEVSTTYLLTKTLIWTTNHAHKYFHKNQRCICA